MMDDSPLGSVDPEGRSKSSGASQDGDLSVGKLAEEAVGELAGLERRLPLTLFRLLTRPGFITLEHKRGRGANYLSPVRLYLLVSTIYFATSVAADSNELSLGLVFVGYSEGPLPNIAPTLILIAAVPLFAVFLARLFPGHPPATGWGEYFIFALYFQSVLLVVLILVKLLPIPDPANDILKLSFFVGYVGLGARRLWSSRLLVAMAKACVSLILYISAVGLTAMAVIGFGLLISG